MGIRTASAAWPIKSPPPEATTTATAVVSPSQPTQVIGARKEGSPGSFERTTASRWGIETSSVGGGSPKPRGLGRRVALLNPGVPDRTGNPDRECGGLAGGRRLGPCRGAPRGPPLFDYRHLLPPPVSPWEQHRRHLLLIHHPAALGEAPGRPGRTGRERSGPAVEMQRREHHLGRVRSNTLDAPRPASPPRSRSHHSTRRPRGRPAPGWTYPPDPLRRSVLTPFPLRSRPRRRSPRAFRTFFLMSFVASASSSMVCFFLSERASHTRGPGREEPGPHVEAR